MCDVTEDGAGGTSKTWTPRGGGWAPLPHLTGRSGLARPPGPGPATVQASISLSHLLSEARKRIDESNFANRAHDADCQKRRTDPKSDRDSELPAPGGHAHTNFPLDFPKAASAWAGPHPGGQAEPPPGLPLLRRPRPWLSSLKRNRPTALNTFPKYLQIMNSLLISEKWFFSPLSLKTGQPGSHPASGIQDARGAIRVLPVGRARRRKGTRRPQQVDLRPPAPRPPTPVPRGFQ